MNQKSDENFSKHPKWPESFKKIHCFILEELEDIPGAEYHKYLYFILNSIELLLKNTIEEDVGKVRKIIKDWMNDCKCTETES